MIEVLIGLIGSALAVILVTVAAATILHHLLILPLIKLLYQTNIDNDYYTYDYDNDTWVREVYERVGKYRVNTAQIEDMSLTDDELEDNK